MFFSMNCFYRLVRGLQLNQPRIEEKSMDPSLRIIEKSMSFSFCQLILELIRQPSDSSIVIFIS